MGRLKQCGAKCSCAWHLQTNNVLLMVTAGGGFVAKIAGFVLAVPLPARMSHLTTDTCGAQLHLAKRADCYHR